jgi:hypothetical protein
MVDFIRRHRTDDAPFDVVIAGHTSGNDFDQTASAMRSYAAAGATWGLEDISPWPFGWQWDGPWPTDHMNERIRHGPPWASSDTGGGHLGAEDD